MKFENVLNKILKEEGGFVNDPADSGGKTKAGITQKTYDAFRRKKHVPTRSVAFARKVEIAEIYENIWVESRAALLHPGLNLMHFDFAVNAGNLKSAITLQQLVDVTQDGIIGPKTLAAAALQHPEELIMRYADARRAFYNALASRREKDKRFLRGWLLRTNRIENESLTAAANETKLTYSTDTCSGSQSAERVENNRGNELVP